MNGHVTVAICIRGVLGFVVGVVWAGSRSIYPSRFLHVDHLHPVQPRRLWFTPYSRAESSRAESSLAQRPMVPH